MSQNKNHTEELNKYLNGEMTNEEANRFEKNALKDAFLSDAIEGAETINAKDFTSDIEILNQNISKTSSKRPSLWKVAAVISLLAAVSVTIWFTRDFTQAENKAVADKSEETSELEPQDKKEPQSESGITDKDVADNITSSILADETEASSTSVVETSAVNTSKPKSEKTEIDEKEEMDSNSENDLIAMDDFGISEEHMDHDVIAPEEEMETGEALFRKARVVQQLEAEPEAPTESQAMTIQETPVNETEKFQGVGVSGYGDYDNQPKGFVDAYPIPDYRFFREYIENNLRYPDQAKTEEVEGRVVLELAISPIGNVTSIEVKKGLGSGCDEEAIRLIEEGPKWEPASLDGVNVKTKVKIRIKFELD